MIDVAVAAAILKGLADMEAAGVSGIAVDPMLEESYFNHEAWLSGTSSIMPQKKNPFPLEMARGLISRITAAADASQSALAGKNYTVVIDTIREAHHVVGHIARLCIETGRRAEAIDAAMVAHAASEVLGRPITLDPRKIAESLDPVSVVASRAVDGGASRRGLERLDAELAADRAGLEDIRALLDARVREIIAAA